jgi:hypothetical protein
MPPPGPHAPIPRPPGTPAAAVPADPLRREIAIGAARLIADSGLDYGSAKRRAAEQLTGGRSAPRGAIPDNAEVDAALAEHLAIFDDAHPARVRRMRGVALALMDRMADFRPHLTGAVWKGIVAEHAPIHLQLFIDDPKDVSAWLIDSRIGHEVGEAPHFRGDRHDPVEALMLHWRDEPVLLSLYRCDELRGALRGSPPERGDAAALRRLLDAGPHG